jgi:hypothetical protein
MNCHPTNGAQPLLQRILELRGSGRTPQEITAKIFTPDPETAKCRLEMLIEIILAGVNRRAGNKYE